MKQPPLMDKCKTPQSSHCRVSREERHLEPTCVLSTLTTLEPQKCCRSPMWFVAMWVCAAVGCVPGRGREDLWAASEERVHAGSDRRRHQGDCDQYVGVVSRRGAVGLCKSEARPTCSGCAPSKFDPTNSFSTYHHLFGLALQRSLLLVSKSGVHQVSLSFYISLVVQ